MNEKPEPEGKKLVAQPPSAVQTPRLANNLPLSSKPEAKKPVAQPPSAVQTRRTANHLSLSSKPEAKKHVAQPPSAVQTPRPANHLPLSSKPEAKKNVIPPPPAMLEKFAAANPLTSKPSKYFYRRNLPHIQSDGRSIFVTFRTVGDFILPEAGRSKVLEHCLHDNGAKMNLLCAVVMPDHVHLVFSPRFDRNGNLFGLEEIMSGIKGSSAHSINKMLKRRGAVWQDESFDHLPRSGESVNSKVRYVINNPLRDW